MAEDLDVTAFQAAPADRAVVKASPVADELDDAHRSGHLTPRVSVDIALALALDARAAGGPHDRRVRRAGGQHHAVAGLQNELPPLPLQDERDRAVHAVQDLLIRVAVRRVAIVRPVRPRVARARLPAQRCHQLDQRRHPSILEFESVKPRFLTDCNVGRLARWLRALGYDASYHPRIDDAELVREAAAESRVLLTGVVRAILIRDDEVTAQLRQVFKELGLELKEALTRCIECNAELQARVASTVAERVPPYVRKTQSRYSECPECGRIYWAGTHWQRMREVLAGL